MTGHLTSPDRVSHAQKSTAEAGLDALLVTPGPDLRWLTGYDALPLDQQVRLVEDDWARSVPRLLVFDNCEEEALLDRWRPRTGGARVLVTSGASSGTSPWASSRSRSPPFPARRASSC